MQQDANPVRWLRDGEPAVCIPRYGPLRRAQGESPRAYIHTSSAVPRVHLRRFVAVGQWRLSKVRCIWPAHV